MKNPFNNTKIAFQDKSDYQLRKAYWMFKIINSPFLTKVGTSALNFTVKHQFPFVNTIVKHTLFEQFCGGETRDESMNVVNQLYHRKVGSILDYSVEGAAEDQVFDAVCEEIKKIVEFSIGNPAIPFVVFKPSAFGRIEIYEQVGKNTALSISQKEEWEKVKRRYDEVCSLCHQKEVMVMIDSEESWMQDAADNLVEEMMGKYNQEHPIVWNTLQMYRTGRLEYMQKDLQHAKEKEYKIGYKIVRGAYMEQERERAKKMNYPSPILPTKEKTDESYDATIDFVLDNLDVISGFFGTHNEKSTETLVEKMKNRNIEKSFPKIYLGQLLGMSDHITFFLSENNYNVAKYVPYGPIKDVIPYLTRRAEENTAIAGQTSRELMLIKHELKRRKEQKS